MITVQSGGLLGGIYTKTSDEWDELDNLFRSPASAIIGDDNAQTINVRPVTLLDEGVYVNTHGGNDRITISKNRSAVEAGAGNDSIQNSGDYSTLNGGNGNDTISTTRATTSPSTPLKASIPSITAEAG